MAHYRKIDTRITLDRKFNALPKDSKLIFFHLLTHRHLTSLGAMHITLPGLACELGFSLEELEPPFHILCEQGMVQHDSRAHFLWFPQFLKYNAPESPNAVRAWESALYYLPKCDLRDAVIAHAIPLVQTLATTFQEALPEVFHTLHQPLSIPCVIPSEGLADPGNKEQITINKEQEQKEEEEIVQKNHSEEKEEIEEIKPIVAPTRQKTGKPPDSEIGDVFRCWQSTLGHPQAQLDVKRRKRIRNALASGYNVSQLCEAIRGCSLTPHNLGENEQGQRYDGLHVILRDADQIDRFIRNAHSPPRRRTEADRLLADNLAAGERWLARFQNEEKIINENE